MKIFKGFVLSILSLLLFLSLSVFGAAFMIKSTLLNPNFIAAEVDKLNVSSLARELVGEQFDNQLPQGAQVLIKEAVYNIISAREPWIKEQLRAAVYSTYDFLLGKSQHLSLVIPLEPLKKDLRDSVEQAFMQSLPSQLAGLTPAQVEQYFEQYYQEFSKMIPSDLKFDEGLLPPEVTAQIIQVRQYISYFQIAYNALIGFMVLLVLSIILINRNIGGTTREMGITFLLCGAIDFAGFFLARHFLPTSLPLGDIPSSLQTWLLGLTGDLLTPLQTFSLGLLIGGVALVVVSFFFKPHVAGKA